jgi:ABC-type uncharacterized transport system substrate-binding protein
MKKFITVMICMILGLFFSSNAFSLNYSGKKVLYIDSYHKGYAWSDGITKGVQNKFKGTGVKLKVIRMDTKRHSDDAFKKEAAVNAKAVIKEFRPDVVIASDDNAAKYLIVPYYKDTDLPFVFCGLNWDEKVYGFPCSNVTGMVEVTPIPILLEQMELYAKGKRVGFIGPDIITARKEAENYRKVFGLEVIEYYAKNFNDWKKGYKQLQNEADMLIVASDGGLYDDHTKEYEEFVIRNSRIPSGTSYDFMAHVALIGVIKIAEEQGQWAADAALKILDGTSPADIPVVKNKRAKLFINKKLSDSMGLDLSIFPRIR